LFYNHVPKNDGYFSGRCRNSRASAFLIGDLSEKVYQVVISDLERSSALAASRSALARIFLLFSVRLVNTLPPLILLFGVSLNQEENCLAVSNLNMPVPIPLMNDKAVADPIPGIAKMSVPSIL